MQSTSSVSSIDLPIAHVRRKLGAYWELTKPRLSLLSVITALAGYLAANPVRDAGKLIALVIGTSLAAGGAAALNQWLERDLDARMARTRTRPLPMGQISLVGALLWGLVLSYTGTWLLFKYVNGLSALLGVATIVSYILVYTPLKTRTPWCTHMGAIPGALPPLIGWAAATGTVSGLGWVLFGVLFAWQIPHFMAIAWTYRRDYAQAAMPMITVVEPSGRRAAREAFFFSVLLLGVSVWPVFLGQVGWFYGSVALVCGVYMIMRAWSFLKATSKDRAARKLFFASIFYLPPVLAALVIDQWLLG